ncbi:MAG TPA: hypothetical protein PKN33_12905 [Phycisphaerae bacterium]|nr:hypothetical protein [Phycisphaerae bacterium]
MPTRLGDLMNATISLSAIAIGFLATAKSVILSIKDEAIIRTLKESGDHDRLLGYFMKAIRWSFGLGILSAIGLLIDFEADTTPHPWLFSIWLFTLAETGFCSYRVIDLFTRILRATD